MLFYFVLGLICIKRIRRLFIRLRQCGEKIHIKRFVFFATFNDIVVIITVPTPAFEFAAPSRVHPFRRAIQLTGFNAFFIQIVELAVCLMKQSAGNQGTFIVFKIAIAQFNIAACENLSG